MTDKTLDRIADALEKLADALTDRPEEWNFNEVRWLTDRYAANEARQREEAQADPLDENDHRDRLDRHGAIWQRAHEGCWMEPGFPPVSHGPAECLQLAALPGPLTFASDASPAPQDAAQDAAKGKDGAAEGGEAAGPSGALLCHECGHDIDWHFEEDLDGETCAAPGSCKCKLWPSQIARRLIAQATS